MLFLEGIHASGIFHADIKPEQMLEMPDGSTTVCDYGMMHKNNLTCGTSGTPIYMAPEVADRSAGLPAYDAGPADIYSAGLTLFAMIACNHPYKEGDGPRKSLLDNATSRRRIAEAGAEELLFGPFGMLRDPGQRPTATDVLKNNWLTEEDAPPMNVE